MIRRAMAVGVCLVLFWTAACFGEERKDEWKDQSFDFRTVRSVVVQLSVDSALSLSEADRKKVEELIETQVLKAGNQQRIRFVSQAELEGTIGKIIDEDMGRLRLEDSAKYDAALNEYTPKLAEAVLDIQIKALATTQVFVPESMYTYTEYQTSYVTVPVYGANGNVYYTTQAVQVPVQRTSVIPAHYETVGHAGAEFSLKTTGASRKVWLLVDMRDGNGREPVAMLDRIVKRAMDEFREVTKKP